MVKQNKTNNYFKLGLIILGVALVTLLVANIYKNVSNNKVNSSYLAKHVSRIDYNEIGNAKLEFSGDTFLYISYTGEKEIYNLETKLKKIIEEHNLSSQFILLDMSNELEKSDYLASLNGALGLTEKPIKRLPAIVYYEDDKAITFIDSADQLLTSSDFFLLLEKYEIIKSYSE